MPQPQFIDKYQIIGPLGGGAFGDVYHAYDRALGIEKAIKVLRIDDPAMFAQALQEAQVLAGCVHKHIVQINEANIFDVNGDARIVLDLEYIPQGSLQTAIDGRHVSVAEAVSYVRGALHGLEHAHAQGFLHRDIKPGNILLSPNCPKLSDFGLASQPGPTAFGSPQGYIPHLPPEFFANRVTSVQTDVFAAGVTLFRALNNIADWRAVVGSVPNVQRHLERGTLLKEIGYATHVPAAIARIASKACAPDATKRFRTADEFGQKLDALRFNIDWVPVSPTGWVGSDGSAAYSAEADLRRLELVVKKNDRRVGANCVTCQTAGDVMIELEKHIASTTLV